VINWGAASFWRRLGPIWARDGSIWVWYEWGTWIDWLN
jgi:hypothetical protein